MPHLEFGIDKNRREKQEDPAENFFTVPSPRTANYISEFPKWQRQQPFTLGRATQSRIGYQLYWLRKECEKEQAAPKNRL